MFSPQPANIFLDAEGKRLWRDVVQVCFPHSYFNEPCAGNIKLGDFGLAKDQLEAKDRSGDGAAHSPTILDKAVVPSLATMDADDEESITRGKGRFDVVSQLLCRGRGLFLLG